MDKQIKVHIPYKVYAKVQRWVDQSAVEVSGFGKVTYSDGVFTVVDAWILDHHSSSYTEIEAYDLGSLAYKTRETEGDLNWWWHSHVNMDVFWSQTDKDTISGIGQNGYCVATVFNKKKQYRSAFSYCAEVKPTHESLAAEDFFNFQDEIPTEITLPDITVEEIAQWDAELKEVQDKCLARRTALVSKSKGKKGSQMKFPQGNDDPYDSYEYPEYGYLSDYVGFHHTASDIKEIKGFLAEDFIWNGVFDAECFVKQAQAMRLNPYKLLNLVQEHNSLVLSGQAVDVVRKEITEAYSYMKNINDYSGYGRGKWGAYE